MIGAVTRVIEWWIRFVVGFSLGGHVVLAFLAGVRRREGPGVGMVFLWLAYQVANLAAPYFLSNLSLGSTLREQQLVELWVPSIVAHLAGPDNITAYSLEDNKLSIRLYFSAILQIIQIIWLMYQQFKIVTSRGALFWASLVMTGVGVCKYAEKVAAFWKADFGNIGSSGKTKKKKPYAALGRWKEVVLGNEQALLLAHQLLDITKAAFADKFYFGKDEEEQLKQDTNLKEVFSVNRENTGWKNMCKVVEMELSLMYDILYTKAAVIHNWYGFVIRVASSVVTATVIVLFWLTGSKDGERTADVIITYVLLAVTFLLDVRCLLGAAASTWTYTFFSFIPWLRHEVCCSGRWHRLRRFVASLDPLPLRMHGGGYRLWSGTIGQYNLFHECTQGQGGTTGSLWTRVAKKLKWEDALMECRYSSRLRLESSNNDVKVLLFEQIQKLLKMDMPAPPLPMAPRPYYPLPPHDDGQFTNDKHRSYVEVIEAVSDYMAFLAAVRPDMLPGLKLSSLHHATRQTLEGLRKCAGGDMKQLINTLREEEKKEGQSTWRHNKETKKRSALYDQSIVLSDGVKFDNLLSEKVMLSPEHWKANREAVIPEGSNSRKRFEFLIPDLELKSDAGQLDMLDLLPLLLKSWVRLLIYVSIRCGRDSHSKQLGRGCELTTVVWILSEHAAIFAPEARDGR
ncbi:hypothetical protein BS78_05G254500 [Paspalum vaginatum]|nr:hypothetical protein BS78_05G254500 [Paspalum vaginatum]KAJ1276933.1 hypothetical protein BS78_05G254500 [Paspalum vaginatum]